VTTMKDYLWMLTLIAFVLTLVNAYMSWGGRAISGTFALGRARNLNSLHHQRPTSQSIDLMLPILAHGIPGIATARP
jgi:Cft2 family RNA processing exonuclease